MAYNQHRSSLRYLLFVIAIGFLPLLAYSEETSSVSPKYATKAITYRGGIVAFAIPANWREEYESDGGATFFEDGPDSGTLRLNVISASSKDISAQQMAATAFPPGSFEVLPSGFPLRKAMNEAEEQGHKLRLYSWEIAVPVPPHLLRIITFRHTILAGQEKNPAIANELEFIDHSIRSATFSQAAGVSDTFRHE
jgi:hypothetical protein